MWLGVLLGFASSTLVSRGSERDRFTGCVNKKFPGSFYRLRRGVMVRMRRGESTLKVQWRDLVGIEGCLQLRLRILTSLDSVYMFGVELSSPEVLFYSPASRHLFFFFVFVSFKDLCCIHLLAPGGTCYLAGSWLWKGPELEALRWAMENMLQHSTYQSFRTDCKDLIAMLKEPHAWPSFATELERIETLQICFPDFSIIHVPRARNQTSDFLAKTARSFHRELLFIGCFIPV
ncbi:hypothetical protein IGI04_014155 [Brassica rapa subsp. trilocularis]|uniref:RNase H type-1 domain-containing protein n=1 Tax=Brassica rapa subsp. trilocularis TaxID=1813537 RepID=A0ABQ7MLE0_BRACM|nr:hypothetical protein IGI04_014155 [Brassica rapa subsp. trilocularis]